VTSGARILVIEDDDDLRDLACEALVERGYELIAAANGAEGIALLRSCPPDLVLLDLRMPVIDGWEVLRVIRTSPSLALLPVLIASAEYDPNLRGESLLRKPYTSAQLVAAVAAQLKRAAVASVTTSGVRAIGPVGSAGTPPTPDGVLEPTDDTPERARTA
jgi:CheY-like chemotaxis protein